MKRHYAFATIFQTLLSMYLHSFENPVKLANVALLTLTIVKELAFLASP